MKCPNCGETSRIREKDKYCHKCGCKLKAGVLQSNNGMTKEERLEETLLRFIERVCDNPLTEDETKILPSMTMALIEMWKETKNGYTKGK